MEGGSKEELFCKEKMGELIRMLELERNFHLKVHG